MNLFYRIFDRRKQIVLVREDRRKLKMKEADDLLHKAISDFNEAVSKLNGHASKRFEEIKK